jgi:hypothetical protein
MLLLWHGQNKPPTDDGAPEGALLSDQEMGGEIKHQVRRDPA